MEPTIMKIHLISDLHCDFARYEHEFPDCDVVVIAGDIGEDPNFLTDICNFNPTHRIIFVPGNHCFYGASIDSRMKTFKRIESECSNLNVLQNKTVEIDGVLFFGSTLWSGLDAYPHWKDRMETWYAYNISDSRYITGWSTDLMLDEHRHAKRKLNLFLEQKTDQKKIVVTHFAPSLNSVHPTYVDQVPFNSYWCNNLPDSLIVRSDLWLHGHVHNNFDYVIAPYDSDRTCRVVCNPRGYVTSYGHENPDFDPNLVLEI